MIPRSGDAPDRRRCEMIEMSHHSPYYKIYTRVFTIKSQTHDLIYRICTFLSVCAAPPLILHRPGADPRLCTTGLRPRAQTSTARRFRRPAKRNAPHSSRPRSNLRRSARGRDPLGARRPTHIVPSPCRARRACKRAARRPRVGLHHRSTRPTEAHRRVCSIEAHRSTSKHIEGSAPSKLHRSTRLTCLKWQRGTLVPL